MYSDERFESDAEFKDNVWLQAIVGVKVNGMRVTAWNNGSHYPSGAGYGLRVSAADRDLFFDRSSASILLVLADGNEITVNTDKASFWNDTCRELISQRIGRWLIDDGLAPWPKGQPPEFELTKTGERFLLSKLGG